MPEHHDPAEAVAAAAEAIEKLAEDDKTNKTPSVGPFSDHKLRSLAALILASTSLLATLGTFLKTCDHSVTEHSYNTLSDSITKLSDEQRKTHDDLVAMHGYLAGLSHEPIYAMDDAGPSAIPTAVPSVSATTSASGLRPLNRPPTIVAQQPGDGGLITFAIQAPPLPSVHPAASSVKPPPFAQIQ